jgi:hypothetical protein
MTEKRKEKTNQFNQISPGMTRLLTTMPHSQWNQAPGEEIKVEGLQQILWHSHWTLLWAGFTVYGTLEPGCCSALSEVIRELAGPSGTKEGTEMLTQVKADLGLFYHFTYWVGISRWVVEVLAGLQDHLGRTLCEGHSWHLGSRASELLSLISRITLTKQLSLLWHSESSLVPNA